MPSRHEPGFSNRKTRVLAVSVAPDAASVSDLWNLFEDLRQEFDVCQVVALPEDLSIPGSNRRTVSNGVKKAFGLPKGRLPRELWGAVRGTEAFPNLFARVPTEKEHITTSFGEAVFANDFVTDVDVVVLLDPLRRKPNALRQAVMELSRPDCFWATEADVPERFNTVDFKRVGADAYAMSESISFLAMKSAALWGVDIPSLPDRSPIQQLGQFLFETLPGRLLPGARRVYSAEVSPVVGERVRALRRLATPNLSLDREPVERLSLIMATAPCTANYLERALKSIADQEDPGCELEVCLQWDGAQNDADEHLVGAAIKAFHEYCNYKRDRGEFVPDVILKFEANGCNVGVNGTRNRALLRVTGDAVVTFDPDDTMPPQATKVIKTTFDRNPQAAFVLGKSVPWDGTSSLASTSLDIPEFAQFDVIGGSKEACERLNYPVICVRADELRAAGGWPAAKRDGDLKLLNRLAWMFRGVGIDFPCRNYFQHDGMITRLGVPRLALRNSYMVMGSPEVTDAVDKMRGGLLGPR